MQPTAAKATLMKIAIAAVGFLAFSVGVASAAPARTYDLSAARQLVAVYGQQISPDGSKMLYVRQQTDFAKDGYDDVLVLYDLKSHSSRVISVRRGLSGAQWTPNGNAIVFTAPVTKGGATESQIFVMPMNGGDPKQITDFPHGIRSFALSPNGKTFAVLTENDNLNQAQMDKHLGVFEVGSNDYLHTSATPSVHLWLISASGDAAKRLTDGTWSAALVNPDYGGTLSWSADGKRIAIVRFPTPILGDALGATAYAVDASTGKLTKITHNSGLEGNPTFAPVGDELSYFRPTKGHVPNGNALYVTRVGDGNGVDVRADIGRNVDGAVWAPNGKAVWIVGTDETRDVLWYQPLHGKAIRVNLGGRDLAGMGNASNSGAIAVSLATPNHPADLFVIAKPGATPVQITHENAYLKNYTLGRVTTLAWTNDGFHEGGVLTYPPHYVKGKKYPLVLLIHGGPQQATTISWNSRRELFASRGYLVLEPNYRGSSDMGDRYQAAIARDAGAGPGRDVMAGVRAAQRLGIVDNARIAVSGWSYGGYMTSWLEGHYHIWACAMEGAAVDDDVYDYDISFYVHDDEPYFGGSPWDPKYAAIWRSGSSPIAFAQQIKTPTLILGDIGDANVPIANSFEMYRALKDNGVTVEFYAYPVGGHFPGGPARSEDVNRRWMAWLGKYLGGHA